METATLSNGPHAAARGGLPFRPRRGPSGGGTVDLTTERHGDVLAMAVAGRLHSAAAAALAEALDDAIAETDRAAILDLEAVDFIGSAGLRVVLATAKRLRGRNARLVLCAPAEPVRDVLRITGLDRFLPIRETVAEALASLEG